MTAALLPSSGHSLYFHYQDSQFDGDLKHVRIVRQFIPSSPFSIPEDEDLKCFFLRRLLLLFFDTTE
jgi:hypothetical protein